MLFTKASEALLAHRRESLRTLARVKALESMVCDSLPKDRQDAWHRTLNERTKAILQRYLEQIEDQNAGAAASIDDRPDWEVPK